MAAITATAAVMNRQHGRQYASGTRSWSMRRRCTATGDAAPALPRATDPSLSLE